MTEKEKVLLLSYQYNNRTYLEREVVQLRSNLRYRDVDSVDCMELMLAIERLNMFNKVFRDVYAILKIRKYTDFDENKI
jgi:acyl carrier protein